MGRIVRGLAATALALTGVACGGGSGDGLSSTTTDAPADTTTDGGTATGAGDVDQAIVEASRSEGSLLVYGNPNDDQFAPLLDAFRAAYPWIDVEALSLSGPEVFQRYLSEEATGTRTADVIVNNEAPGWLDMVERGQVVDYEEPALAGLPDYARLAPGVVSMSFDPVIAIFNNALLPEDQQPTTLAELAAMAGDLDGRIGTYDIDSATGFAATWYYLQAAGDAGWDVLDDLGAHTSAESSGGTLASKLTQGQYEAVFFMSGAARALAEGDASSRVANWAYLTDATPLLPRGVGVTTAAESPNAAKLFVNFLLSVDGQQAGCAGGFTPYRDGVDCEYDLASIEDAVGADNVIIGSYDPAMVDERAALIDRWNTAFGR